MEVHLRQLPDLQRVTKKRARTFLKEAIHEAERQSALLEITVHPRNSMDDIADVLFALGRIPISHPVRVVLTKEEIRNERLKKFLKMHPGILRLRVSNS